MAAGTLIKTARAARLTRLSSVSRAVNELDDALRLGRSTNAIADPVRIADNTRVPSTELRQVAFASRNSRPLTAAEVAEATDYAKSLGATDDMFYVSDTVNTSYGNIFGKEILQIGPDLLPGFGTVSGMTANARVSLRATIAHELVGHRAAAQAGFAFKVRDSATGLVSHVSNVLEESQASIRAARFAPGLTDLERYVLLRDGVSRLRSVGLRVRDVRELMHIHSP